MRYKVVSLLVVLSLCAALLWRVGAATRSTILGPERLTKSAIMSDKEKTDILPQMLALNRLSANYNRVIREYDEEGTSTDTLKWGYERTTEEVMATLRGLLAQRKVLAQLPVKELIYQIQVRRAQNIFLYGDIDKMSHRYDAVLSTLMRFWELVRYSDSEYSLKEKMDAFVADEISSACGEGFYAEGLVLCEFLCGKKNRSDERIKALVGFRPLFEGKDEEVMIDFLILREREWEKVSDLKSQVLSFDASAEDERAWVQAEQALVRGYERLVQKLTISDYKKRINAAKAEVLAPVGRLALKDYEAGDGAVTVQVVAITDQEVEVKSLRTKSSGWYEEGGRRTSARVLAPKANRVVRQNFREALSGTGHYHYTLGHKSSDRYFDRETITHDRLRVMDHGLDDRHEFFALDPYDGKPIKGVRGILYDRTEQREISSVIFDDKGHASVLRQTDDMYLVIKDDRLADDKYRSYIYRIYDTKVIREMRREVKVYTDRPIYRYGQVVKAGLVFYNDNPEGFEVVPNHSDRVIIYADIDGKRTRLAAMPIKTNANGVAEIAYTLPKDEAYTNFVVATEGAYQTQYYINVQSYKLQHLQVHIDSIPSGYVIGRPMIIHGRMTDLNGHPSSGRVTISYDTEKSEKTISQDVDESGRFEVRTLPISDLRSYYRDYLRVSAIDALGRIATTSLGMQKDSTDLPLSAGALISVSALDKADFTLGTESQPYAKLPLGALDRYSVYAYLKGAQGEVVELGRLPIKGSKTFSMPTLKSGAYTLGLRATDGYGNQVVNELKEVYVYGRKDKQPPVPMPLWVMPYSPQESNPKDLLIRVGSSHDLSILMIVKDKEDIVHYDVIRADKNMVTVRIPRRFLSGSEAKVTFSTIRNGDTFREELEIPLQRQEDAKGVTIELLDENKTFVPGAEVSRRYIIKDGGKPLTDAAVLVTVFDKAVLDVAGGRSFWQKISRVFEFYGQPRLASVKDMGMEVQTMNVASVEMATSRSAPMAAKGGGFDEVEIETRSDFSETAYFTALLTTNAKGEVDFKYSLPHTQTKYVEKVFVFDKKLEAQEIEDHHFDVFAPVSVEINLPRYLTRGDKMIGEVLLRNTQKIALPISYRVLIGDDELTSGTQTVAAESATAVRFELLPAHLIGDSLSLTAQIITDGYSDAVKRTIPLRSHLMEYGVAVPFSLYKGTQVTLDLPKSDKFSSVPNLFAYFNPTNLVLTRLAQEYTMSMEHSVDQLSIYGALHHFVVFSNIRALFRTHPEVRASIVEALPDLHEAAKRTPSVDLKSDRGHFMSQRLTDPRTLVYFYDFVTDDHRLEEYLKHLTKRIKSAVHADGGWTFVREYPSTWLTLYVLKMLGDAPESERVSRLSKEIGEAFAFLDKEYKKERNRYLSLIDYAVIRHAHGLDIKTMDKAFTSRLKEEADTARKGYRNFWVSALLRYGRFARIYGDVKHNSEVQTFIDDMSRHTFSDSEQVGFELYKQARDKVLLSENVVALLLRHKQGVIWDDTYSIEAIKLLLTHVTPTKVDRGATLVIDGRVTALTDVERAMGFVTRQLDGVGSRVEVALDQGITTDFFFGGVVYHVTEPMVEVTPTGEHLKVFKEVFARRVRDEGKTAIVPVTIDAPAFKGEKLIVRYTVETNRDLSLVTIRDDRPAGSEPGYNLNGYKISDRVWWAYRRTESADQLFVDYIPRGRHVFELEATATTEGAFVYGPAEVVSYYAPEFRGNSAGGALSVVPHKRK